MKPTISTPRKTTISIRSLLMGNENGTSPHSKGTSFSAVGLFFPSVEPRITISAAIPAAITKLTAIPRYSLTSPQLRGQYIIAGITAALGHGLAVWRGLAADDCG